MRRFILTFLLGNLFWHAVPSLPPADIVPWLGGAGAIALGCACLLRLPAVRGTLWCVAGLALGSAGAGWATHQRLADRLDAAAEGEDLQVVGVVTGLPVAYERGLRFQFRVERGPGSDARAPESLALNWYPERQRGAPPRPPPALKPGERWQLAVRLRAPHGFANPHGFDFELWALERNLRATGYVRTAQGAPNQRLASDAGGWLERVDALRAEIRERMRAVLPEQPYVGVLIALVMGDQNAIPPEQWKVFWRTGVGHLMSISGLHITMLAGLAAALAPARGTRRPRVALVLPARRAAALAGAVTAIAYSLIAGMSVPTQRTLCMLLTVALALWLGRATTATRVLAVAALVVMLIDPWATLSPGFWLSFGAVAAMFHVGNARIGRLSGLQTAVSTQLAITLLMAPASMVLFQEVSLVSPIANAFAIPLVSLVVVPLALGGAFLQLEWLLDLAHGLMGWTMVPLEWLAALPDATWQSHAPPLWATLLALAGGALLLAPRALPLRKLGVAMALPIFLVRPEPPAPGEAWIDLLDVGQGLAMVVRTHAHTLVYDTGARLGAENDIGSRVVTPHLRGEGLRELDLLVVTHGDDDHAGGAVSVIHARRPRALATSLDADHEVVEAARANEIPVRQCLAGERWQWEGVSFEFLHPQQSHYEVADTRRSNDMACVLEVTAASGANALLTSDIEARSERELIARYGRGLQADVLLIPHHGSKTSSTSAFLDLVHPDIALLPVGYRNRFHHPHPDVMARYVARGIAVYRTDSGGRVRVVLPATDAVPRVSKFRDEAPHYWRSRNATE